MPAKQNMITITGNLTREPELRFSQKGNAFANLGVAWNKNRRDPDGEWKSEPHFFDVTCFGSVAENVAETATTGTRVTIVGHVEQERWEKDGQKRSKVVIVAENVGVDLQFATATVAKNEKGSGGDSAAAAKADEVVQGVIVDDDEPF